MLMRSSTLRRLSSAVSILVIAAACSDDIPTKPGATRSFAPALSRVASPAAGQHVFVLNGNLPEDFAARVTARGGNVLSAMPQIGVVVTQGLSDADASALAGKES